MWRQVFNEINARKLHNEVNVFKGLDGVLCVPSRRAHDIIYVCMYACMYACVCVYIYI